jgi:hypothetical protein
VVLVIVPLHKFVLSTLVLLLAGNDRGWGDLQQHNVDTKFHENRPISSKRDGYIHLPTYPLTNSLTHTQHVNLIDLLFFFAQEGN